MLIKVAEAAVNRVTVADVEKALRKLQKQGGLNSVLHEVTAASKYVQNHIANASGEVRDNTLNAPERKIVTRVLLKHIISQFGYTPEDL